MLCSKHYQTCIIINYYLNVKSTSLGNTENLLELTLCMFIQRINLPGTKWGEKISSPAMRSVHLYRMTFFEKKIAFCPFMRFFLYRSKLMSKSKSRRYAEIHVTRQSLDPLLGSLFRKKLFLDMV